MESTGNKPNLSSLFVCSGRVYFCGDHTSEKENEVPCHRAQPPYAIYSRVKYRQNNLQRSTKDIRSKMNYTNCACRNHQPRLSWILLPSIPEDIDREPRLRHSFIGTNECRRPVALVQWYAMNICFQHHRVSEGLSLDVKKRVLDVSAFQGPWPHTGLF